MRRSLILWILGPSTTLALLTPATPARTQGLTPSPPQLVLNFPTMYRPADFAISPDGQFAIVRTGSFNLGGSNAGELFVVDLTPPITAASVVVQQAQDYSLYFYACDALGFVDDRCCSLGGDTNAPLGTGDQFLQLVPPWTLQSLGGGGVDFEGIFESGTGNGIAVVRPVVGLVAAVDVRLHASLTPAAVPAFKGAAGTPTFGNALGLSNALRATSSRFVVISNLYAPSSGAVNAGFVGIGSYHAGAPGAIGTTHGFACNPLLNCNPSDTFSVHDVTLTPNEKFAIVSGNRLYGVFNVATGAVVSSTGATATSITSGSELPRVGHYVSLFKLVTADSVEATNARAVIVGADSSTSSGCSPSQDPAQWRVAIVNLRTFADVVYEDPVVPASCVGSRAHDVAITPNGQWAIMTTRGGTYRIDLSTATWPTPAPQPYNDGNDPLDVNASLAFVSDSVVCTNTRAVAIGRNRPGNAPQVVVIDPNVAPNAPGAFTVIPLLQVNLNDYVTPTDVVIDPSERFAIVRSKRSLGALPPNAESYGRVSVIDLVNALLVAEFDEDGLNADLGAAWGLDHIECGAGYAVTGGEDENTGAGWFQIFTIP